MAPPAHQKKSRHHCIVALYAAAAAGVLRSTLCRWTGVHRRPQKRKCAAGAAFLLTYCVEHPPPPPRLYHTEAQCGGAALWVHLWTGVHRRPRAPRRFTNTARQYYELALAHPKAAHYMMCIDQNMIFLTNQPRAFPQACIGGALCFCSGSEQRSVCWFAPCANLARHEVYWVASFADLRASRFPLLCM